MVDNSKITTIKLDKTTKSRLDKLKGHKKESYDEVIQKVLYILNLCKANPMAARAKLIGLDRAKELQQMKPRRSSSLN